MKKLFFLATIVSIFTACVKEGPQGRAGEDGSFTVYNFTSAAADWNGGTYVEYPCPIITQSFIDKGIVLVYVQDEFGYWNPCPSVWHSINGFSYSSEIIGLDATTAPTIGHNVRVVTMNERALLEVGDPSKYTYQELMNKLSAK
ncbi:MAG: hypothetical protein FJX90_03490 [Bacteroidetes bacterium]|nr:hypothetical protein [Bacteroidota bacterium]